jgi:hypothetical protein
MTRHFNLISSRQMSKRMSRHLYLWQLLPTPTHSYPLLPTPTKMEYRYGYCTDCDCDHSDCLSRMSFAYEVVSDSSLFLPTPPSSPCQRTTHRRYVATTWSTQARDHNVCKLRTGFSTAYRLGYSDSPPFVILALHVPMYVHVVLYTELATCTLVLGSPLPTENLLNATR